MARLSLYKARLSLEMEIWGGKKGKREEKKIMARVLRALIPCEEYKTLEDLVY